MKNKFMLIVALALLSLQASYGVVEQTFNSSSTGSASATTFVPAGNGVAEVRDLSWRVDAANVTATIGQYIGARKFAITSATSSAASVLWIDNPSTMIAVYEFIIFLDADTGQYYLRRVQAASTTSITVNNSIAVTTTTSDSLWSTLATVEKPANNPNSITGAAAGGLSSMWFPANVPTALVIDGNTTSCRISISGVRGNRP